MGNTGRENSCGSSPKEPKETDWNDHYYQKVREMFQKVKSQIEEVPDPVSKNWANKLTDLEPCTLMDFKTLKEILSFTQQTISVNPK